MTRWLVVGTLVAVASSATAAPRVTRIITATSDVHDIVDYRGDRLFATAGGIVVQRGNQRSVLTSRDGLPGVRFSSLSVTQAGVWAGGVDGVVLLRRQGQDYRVIETLKLRRVRRVIVAHGATWFATYGKGLYRRAGDRRMTRVNLGRYIKLVTDLVADRHGTWVATAGTGIVRLSATGRRKAVITHKRGLASDLVWRLYRRNGHLVAATAAGISVVRGYRVLRKHPLAIAGAKLPIRDVRAMARRGATWYAATFGAGVYRLANRRARRVVGAPKRLRALVVDGLGLVVGHARGATRLHNRRAQAVLSGGLHNPDVTAIARAFGRVWLGTFDDGLAAMDRSGAVRRVSVATRRWRMDRRINDLAVTGRGKRQRLWIATDRGLWRYDSRSFMPELSAGGPGRVHITALHVDGRGALWVTSPRAVSRLLRGTWRAYTGDARAPRIQAHAVTTDATGRVWIGTLNGLMRLDQATGALTHFNSATGDTAVDWITSVHPWGNSVVAGTYHGGLSWPAGKRFALEKPSRTGLPSGWVNPHAMTSVAGKLWFGALDGGLVIGSKGSWQRLQIKDGLPSNDVTAIFPVDKRTVLIATRGGLAQLAID